MLDREDGPGGYWRWRRDAGQYLRLASRLGIADRVRFLDRRRICVRGTRRRTWPHPTWYDPCSRVVLEALSLLPVVTTLERAAEVLEPGKHAVIETPADTAGLRPRLRAA